MAGTKILIADDDPEIRATLAYALSASGYSTALAADGEEAMAYLAKHPVEILILDIMMPRVSGIDVLRHVKGCHPSLKVIVLSGYLGESLQKECERLGALHTLSTPYDLEDLMAIVAAV